MALLNFLHLFATVAWIGGVVFIMLVFVPVLGRHEELGPMAGSLSIDVAKRFMRLVWGSVVLFLITGVPMTIFNPRYMGIDLSNPWYAAILTKHIAVAVMVIAGVALTSTIRRIDQIMGAAQTQPPSEKPPSQPTPELQKLTRRQTMISITVFILGILVLLLTAIAEAAFVAG